ncbi:Crp/Fnr family transcriptional regulator [Lachnotalea sp. AF33-28]|uniref:Crp/Fnr family transcriptional regulator n=1 Tax=Lachnotalea sp. AF33-28 TaxID=2292046 RepID=UPI000E470576|nr:Crp/Fnr family transcriptional regulator [Lachnotalea sp. AF33-28]RHP35134.1 Crp/Fnr family transcriptional regulator [Lachnotalea sp. AF33-28]
MDKEYYLAELLPFWKEINQSARNALTAASMPVYYKAGTLLHAGREDCNGLFLLVSGRVRVYSITAEGKEVTLFRLLDRDVCLFSASCIMRNINFDVYISAEMDTEAVRIPAGIYDRLFKEQVSIAGFTNELLSSRMSDVMDIMEQVLFLSFDKRLARFLLDESALEQSDTLTLTHEQIANHLGSAREVVSRMLKYFSGEGLVAVSRGKIRLLNVDGLMALSQ